MAFWRFAELLGGRGDRSDDEEEERGLLEGENDDSEGMREALNHPVCCEPGCVGITVHSSWLPSAM